MMDDNVLNMYLKEINRIPLLNPQDEIDLAKKAHSGDLKAREKLIKSNLRFVITIAKKYQKKGLDLEDLISEGNIGLMTAVEKFDETKGYKFISYAVWWIRQSILRAISDKSRAIRIPGNRSAEVSLIQKAYSTVLRNHEGRNEYEAVAKMLNMDSVHVKEMLEISNEMLSLDQKIEGDENGVSTLGDFVEDSVHESPESQAMEQSLKDEIHATMSTLKPAERKVLAMRFGLEGNRQHSLQEVGEKFSLTRERIRQIEKNAISRMRSPLRSERLKVYVA